MAEKIVIQLETDSKEAVDSIKEVNKSVEATNETTGELTNSLDKMTGGAISGFTGILKSVKKAVLGFKSLKVAIAATGIGALLIAITAIGQAFTRSEEGQNKFAKLMGVIGAVTGQFLDAVADLGEKLITLFTNPQKALSDFTNLIKENLINRFNGLLELVPKLAQAIGLLFQGKFKEAGKVAVNAAAKVTLGVENIVDKTQQAIDKTNEFIKATVEEGKIAGEIADQRAEADKIERDLLVQRAKADRDRANALEKAVNREKFTIEERIGFLEEAGQIEADITNKEIEAAKLRLQAKEEENALGKSTKADLDEEAQLRARVIQLETARLTKQKEVTSQTIALKNEQKAEEKRLEDEAKAEELARLKEIDDAKKKSAEDEKKRTKELEDFKKQAIQQGINGAIALVGQNSKFAKGIAIANAIRDTFAGANKALAQGGIFGFVGAAGIIASGLANVKAITSTKDPTPPSSVTVSSRGATPTPSIASTPPAFNIVGAGGTNQLAEAITGQQQQPVKAFVVSQDVTTAQSLERNIIDGASLG
tara:strand:+ start:36 stop:1649 length:1614 start_codon:yes stop_codon:yes gene_type:complete